MRTVSRWISTAAMAAVCLACTSGAMAEVRLHGLFVDGAVLQRGIRIPVWGTAREGEKVTVTLNGRSASTVAHGGRWMVRLPAEAAGGPYVLSASGDNRVDVNDVMVGEVWVCGGQSNMQWPLTLTENAEAEIAQSGDPLLRHCEIIRRTTEQPQDDVKTAWQKASASTSAGFTAVGYFFGKALRHALNVPVGLIGSNYGGTPAEAWTRTETLARDADLRTYLDRQDRSIAAYPGALMQYAAALRAYYDAAAAAASEGKPAPKKPSEPTDPRKRASAPGGLHNAMIAPLQPYAIRGAIWYQGESNAGEAWLYRNLFPTMIRDWRAGWGQGDFPFLCVQLAPFTDILKEPAESGWAELREAQLLTSLHLAGTGMAVITDVGDEKDIHPRRKRQVGDRLALLARKLAYGEKIQADGPVYAGASFGGGKAVIRFREVGGGLVARGGELTGFTIAGADRKFVNAQAEIKGATVVVSSPSVPKPAAVRFGWANYPVVNLANDAGLYASPFRTDDFPMTTHPAPARR